jgi:hypothetical protein
VSSIGKEALPYLSYIAARIIGILRYYFSRGLVVFSGRFPDNIAVVSLLVIS